MRIAQIKTLRDAIATLACLLTTVTAYADPIDDYDFNWLTISDVGNVAFEGDRFGNFEGYGSVDYEYRVAPTEITSTQYLEFVNAYWPYYTDYPLFSGHFTGSYLNWYGNGNYVISEHYENAPINMAKRNAARYCNWLHNGKINDEWAFLTGAYDATTFTKNQDGTYNDDYTRLDGAKYWIPSVSEWFKATYYDPDKDGPGQGGWWDHSYSSDTPPIIGLPDDDGETNTSLSHEFPENEILTVEMYPHMKSPWGLLDTSGGVAEYAEDRPYASGYYFGAGINDGVYSNYDQIGTFRLEHWMDWALIGVGLRIGSQIPTPSTLMVLTLLTGCSIFRRKV